MHLILFSAFITFVEVDGKKFKGEGPNKKESGRQAAKQALIELGYYDFLDKEDQVSEPEGTATKQKASPPTEEPVQPTSHEAKTAANPSTKSVENGLGMSAKIDDDSTPDDVSDMKSVKMTREEAVVTGSAGGKGDQGRREDSLYTGENDYFI